MGEPGPEETSAVDREEEGRRAQDNVQLGQQLGRRSRGREGGALLKLQVQQPYCVHRDKQGAPADGANSRLRSQDSV